ncbi:MAG: iron transporter [Solirubrobacterales bacterium]|nr:iron transporter [Solirubrobacterales bacterium]
MGKLRRGAALAVLAAGSLALAGCGSAHKSTTSGMSMGSGAKKSGMTGGSMAGMNMGSSPTVAGIKPIPTQNLGTGNWQGMKITAQAMTPIPFIVSDGTSEHEVKPTKKTSFHLMVRLADAQTNEPLPYATVWTTISKNGKVVYDERQWPMLSRYIGPHYGNDVTLPGAGHYTLSLLVSPPVSARHVEYQHVWLKPHRVNMSFTWRPPS